AGGLLIGAATGVSAAAAVGALAMAVPPAGGLGPDGNQPAREGPGLRARIADRFGAMGSWLRRHQGELLGLPLTGRWRTPADHARALHGRLTARQRDAGTRFAAERDRVLTPPAPHSGAVLDGAWGPGREERWQRLLPQLERLGVVHEHGTADPRAPPGVLEIPLDEAVFDLLRSNRLADLPGRLVGYYWADRELVVVFTPTLHRLGRAGLLDELLVHEDFFHRQGRVGARNEAGRTHDED